jgi:hypothetical protein
MNANAHPRAASECPNPPPHLHDNVLVCFKPPPWSPFFWRGKRDGIEVEGPGGGADDGATGDIKLSREPAA